jgi:hypothetical protein
MLPSRVGYGICDCRHHRTNRRFAETGRRSFAFDIVAAIVLIGGGTFARAFAVLHGAGNGILTIARGTVPLALYGQQNYGYRLGLIGATARIAQAGSPLNFSFAVEYLGGYVLIVSAALCAAASLASVAVRINFVATD